MSDDVVLRAARIDDFPAIVEVWRSSVDATYGFVSPEDLLEIERELIPAFLPGLDLTVASVDGRLVGFAGTAGARLAMMFVHDDFRGKGVGTQLLSRVLSDGVTELEVNEDNPDSVEFYRARGFEVVGRSAVDDAGRPYPMLQMRRSGTESGHASPPGL